MNKYEIPERATEAEIARIGESIAHAERRNAELYRKYPDMAPDALLEWAKNLPPMIPADKVKAFAHARGIPRSRIDRIMQFFRRLLSPPSSRRVHQAPQTQTICKARYP